MTEAFMVIMAAVAYFILSGVYYTIFGKQWMLAWNLKEENLNKKDPIPYLVAFIGSLWTSYGLFIILKHVQPKNMMELMTVALGTWLFVVVGTSMKHYSFARISPQAFIIDHIPDGLGYALMCYLIWS